MNDFISTTRKDYGPKKIKFERRARPDDSHALEGNFKQYLKCEGYEGEVMQYPDQYVNDYLKDEITNKYPLIKKKHFEQDVDCAALADYFRGSNTTTFRADYCKLIKMEQADPNTNICAVNKILANFEYPFSTYRQHFKNPVVLEPKHKPRHKKFPKVTLGENKLSKKLYKTPVSVYTKDICDFGGMVIKNEIYGKIVRPKGKFAQQTEEES